MAVAVTGAFEHAEATSSPFCLETQGENGSALEVLCRAADSPSHPPLCLIMSLPAVVVLLALASLGAASAPDCKDLLRPFVPDDPQQIFGKWVYVMGAGDPKPYHKALESLKSSWIDLSPTSDGEVVTLRWGDNCFNRCIFGEVNATVSGNATTFRKNLSGHKGHVLQTCSDCLLWTDTFQNEDATGRYILQFTRTGKTNPEDVDLFRKQVGCLSFPENFHSYDGETELCPDERERTP
ncbi:alpha-1-acid glycoprotein 1 isoform X2 [Gasterosteus aculeatus]